MKYECYGSVRGSCGVVHRSREAAERHCQEDHAAIRRRYPLTFPTSAYSDRSPRALDDEARDRDRRERDEEES